MPTSVSQRVPVRPTEPFKPVEELLAAFVEPVSSEPSDRFSPPAAQPAEAATFSLPDRDALYGEFQPLVQRLIRQYGSTAEQRQDLSGEIYWRFCCLLSAYDPERGVPLRPYLVRSLTMSVYTYARSQWRRQEREVLLDQSAETAPAASVNPTRQWDDDLEMDEMVQTLPGALAQLTPRQRNVVVWRYYEQRSFEEIAAVLQVRPATVRSLLRHGLNNLRLQMAKREENG